MATVSTGPWAAGNVAAGAADSSNPVKVGGKYNAALPALASGQRGDLQLDASGRLITNVGPSSAGVNNADAVNLSVLGIFDQNDQVGALQSAVWVFNGASWDRPRIPNVFKPQNAVGIASETTIWTPATGKKFRLMGVYLQQSVAGNILLRDNTAGTIIFVVPSAAGGDATFVSLGNGILSAAANNVLTATGAAASTLSGVVFGTEE